MGRIEQTGSHFPTEALRALDVKCTKMRPSPRLPSRGLPEALTPHPLGQARTRGEAEDLGKKLLGDHRVAPTAGNPVELRASFHAVRLHDVTLGYASYAEPVRLEFAPLPEDHMVIGPTSGTCTFCSESGTIDASPVMAATPPPSSTLSIDCPAGVTHLVVRIDRVPLQRHLSRLLGRAIHRDIEFAVPFDLTASRANRWNFGVQMLHAELMDGGSLLQRRAGLGPVEEFLMSSLLYAQRSNYTEELLGERPHPGALVRAACRYIDANLSEPIVVSEIAQSVGVSLRTLQKHFVDQLHQTLSHYVRDRRLDRVRAELAAAAPGSGPSVSDVAERWGFTHLGRFAAAYRDRFGEAPSATLRT